MKEFYVVEGGALELNAPSYVTRDADEELFAHLIRSEYCYILTSRQMGKSSLSVQVRQRLIDNGILVALIDLQGIGMNLTVEQWYFGLLRKIREDLKLDGQELRTFWSARLQLLAEERPSAFQAWIDTLTDFVLPSCKGQIVIFIDEIDLVRNLSFNADEFFVGLRELYSRRVQKPELKRLSFCLLGVAAPTDLISNPLTTPFNIGRRIELTDFSENEAAVLSKGLKRDTDTSKTFLNRILYWTGGHPYLTQRLCKEIAIANNVTNLAGIDDLCKEIFISARSRTTDPNLLFVRRHLLGNSENSSGQQEPSSETEKTLRNEEDRSKILDLYAKIRNVGLVGNEQPNLTIRLRQLLGFGEFVYDDEANPTINILRLSGLTSVSNSTTIRVRNRIYQKAFDKKWIQNNMPDAELQRQRSAEWRGIVRAAIVAGIIISILIFFSIIAFKQTEEAHRQTEEARRQTEEARRQTEEVQKAKLRINDALRDAYIENGRQELVGRKFIKATVYLSEAYRIPVENEDKLKTSNLLFLLKQSVRSVDALSFSLPHSNILRSARFSMDGKRIITASGDGTAKIWDVETGKELASFVHDAVNYLEFSPEDKQDDTINYAEFSPDGKKIVTASTDKTARVWISDSKTDPPVMLKHEKGVNYAGFSPDGKKLITVSDDSTARVWDLANTKTPLFILPHKNTVSSAKFSLDGKKIVTVSWDSIVKVWNAETNKVLAVLHHNEIVNSAEFSRDGKMIVTASNDKTARVWDDEKGKQLASFEYKDSVNYAEFSPDGEAIVTASDDKTSEVRNVKTGEKLLSLTDTKSKITSAKFSPDGKKIVVITFDETANLWDIETGTFLLSLEDQELILSAEFSPDGKKIVTAGRDPAAKIWNTEAKRFLALFRHSDVVCYAGFSPDGKKIVTTSDDKTANIWDVETGEKITWIAHDDSVIAADFSPDGKRLVTVSSDKTAKVWDLNNLEKPLAVFKHKDTIYSADFSPDGKRVITASKDETAKIWDAETGKELSSLDYNYALCSAEFSPDGSKILTASADNLANVWDAGTKEKQNWVVHYESVYWAKFSPDGSKLITASSDKTARVWDLNNTQKPLFFLYHNGAVNYAEFSRDGKKIVTASDDRKVTVWDAETGKELVSFDHDDIVNTAQFSPDGNKLVTASDDKKVKIWDISPETRSSEQIATLVKIKVQYQLRNGVLMPY